MAVVNVWASANVEAGNRENPSKVSGGKVLTMAGTFEKAAADASGSIYKLAHLPANAIMLSAELMNDALAGGTDYDLGLYEEQRVASDALIAADADLLLNGGDLSSAHAITAPLNGLTDLGGADPVAAVGKKLWELLGLSVPSKQGYLLALTANVAGGAAGTISYRVSYILG